MPKVEGYLTVFYTLEVDAPEATPETAEDVLEDAYKDGDLGTLEDHEWTYIELDGKVVVDKVGGGTDG